MDKIRIRALMEAVGYTYQKGGWMYLRGDVWTKSQMVEIGLTWSILASIAVAAEIQELPLFEGRMWKTFEWLEKQVLK